MTAPAGGTTVPPDTVPPVSLGPATVTVRVTDVEEPTHPRLLPSNVADRVYVPAFHLFVARSSLALPSALVLAVPRTVSPALPVTGSRLSVKRSGRPATQAGWLAARTAPSVKLLDFVTVARLLPAHVNEVGTRAWTLTLCCLVDVLP